MTTLYDVLGVDPFADFKDIRAAFVKLAKIHHPDRNPGDVAAAERFREIKAAHELLRDASKREAYNAFLRRERGRAKQRVLRAAVVYSFVFVATFCSVYAGVRQHGASPAGLPADVPKSLPSFTLPQESEPALHEVTAPGVPAAQPAPSTPPRETRLAALLPSEPQERQAATRLLDPVEAEPQPTVGDPTITETASHDGPPLEAVLSARPLDTSVVRVWARYRAGRTGVSRLKLFTVEHESADGGPRSDSGQSIDSSAILMEANGARVGTSLGERLVDSIVRNPSWAAMVERALLRATCRNSNLPNCT